MSRWVQKLHNSVQDLGGKGGERHGWLIHKEPEQYSTLSTELVGSWLLQ